MLHEVALVREQGADLRESSSDSYGKQILRREVGVAGYSKTVRNCRVLKKGGLF